MDQGHITDIKDGLVQFNGIHLINVGESVLMPGVIDPHVHINEPGRTEWEGFDTATQAALCGGITALMDMPLNSLPVTVNGQSLDRKIDAAKKNLHTHCGFWGGIIDGNIAALHELIDRKIPGFKAFLTHSGIEEFPNVTEMDLRNVMPVLAAYNLPLLVHCELSDDKIEINADRKSYSNYLASRPESWEDEAIAMMIRLCEEFNCRVHIVHLSSAGSIRQIQDAKKKGLPLTVETAQHYLFFHAEEIGPGRTEFKCAPPIREKLNNELLWGSLKDGTIDFVATDHSPAPAEIKELESGDFSKAWGGIASLQFALPALWTAARQRDCSLTDMALWLCERPAQLIGKNKSKGKIAIGYDADLIVWNPDREFEVTTDMIKHKHKVTPYINRKLFGVVEQSWLKGNKVFANGILTQRNQGEFIWRD